MPQVRRSKKTLPPNRVRELKKLAKRIDAEESEEIKAWARNSFARHERVTKAIKTLKAERERLGLSLSEVSQRAGIDKANLSRLENAQDPNPTFDTLMRYAQALGRELKISIAGTARAA